MKTISKLLFVALCSVTVVACGSGDPCTSTSKCANDPKRTDAEVQACQDAVKTAKTTYAKCTAQIDAQASCSVANQQCTADGKTDTTATGTKCTKEATDLATCIAAM